LGNLARVSRDIFVQDIPVGALSASDIEDGWRPAPLPFGRADVIEVISDLVLTAEFSRASWGRSSCQVRRSK